MPGGSTPAPGSARPLRAAGCGSWWTGSRYTYIYSQCEFSTFFLARRIAEELDIPLVHTYHTVYEDYTHYFSPSIRMGRCAVAAFSRWWPPRRTA